jgi:hypothetical protein
MMKMGVDPEKGLPSRDDCQAIIGHIRAEIRSFGEVLEEEAAGGPEIPFNALLKIYNNLVDAVIIYLQQWSANREQECASITKIQYAKAPLNGNILFLFSGNGYANFFL